jgi:uncharacterized protein (DUF1015 family)
VRQIDALNAQTGPVFLVYPRQPAVNAILDAATQGTPEVDETAADGVRHELWVLDEPAQVAELTRLFDAMPALYVADGHHRSAAASRVCAARKASNPAQDHGGEEPTNYFLSVIFPQEQMQIMDYNRLIRDLHGLTGSSSWRAWGTLPGESERHAGETLRPRGVRHVPGRPVVPAATESPAHPRRTTRWRAWM